MKLSVKQSVLSSKLGNVARAVATRSTLPVLSNVKLQASFEKGLLLQATNLEISIATWLEAEVEEGGAITVPARTFVDLVNALPNDNVEMSLNERTQTLNVKCGKFKNTVHGIDANEFPLIAKPEGNEYKIDSATLRDGLQKTIIAAADGKERPTLTGVMMTASDGKLVMAASDGFRLSVFECDFDGKLKSVIVPARALAEVVKNLDEPETTLCFDGVRAGFRSGDTEILCQLIEGNFPDYTQIIPKNSTTIVIFNTDEMIRCCKAALVFAKGSNNITKLSCANGQIEVSAISQEEGDSLGVFDAQIDGDDVIIAFNVKYLQDAISVMGTEETVMKLTSHNGPGLFMPVGKSNFRAVCMPMNLFSR